MPEIKYKNINLNIHNLTKDNLNDISVNDDLVLKNYREKCFEKYTELPFFFSRYTKINKFNFNVDYDLQTLLYKQILDTKLRLAKDFIFCDIKHTSEKFLDLKKYLNKIYNEKENKLEILSEVLFNNGFFIYVPENLKVNLPLHLITEKLNEVNIFGFNLVILEKASSLNLIIENQESGELPVIASGTKQSLYESQESEAHIFGENTHYFIEEGGELNLVKIQNTNENFFKLESNNFYLNGEANIKYFNINLGSQLALNFNKSFLSGAGANYNETQVIIGKGKQNFNIQSKIYYQANNTKGYCNVKTVLQDKSQSTFEGTAKINKQVEEVDSFISNKTLLLSNTARCNTIPSLEIESSNVKASHQATVSKIDEEQLYYLTSRGLSEEESKKILVESFIQDEIEKINIESAKEKIIKIIFNNSTL